MKNALLGSLAIGLVLVSSSALADDVVQGPPAPAPTTTATTTTTSSPLDPSTQPPPPEKDTVTLYQSHRPNKAYLYTGGLIFLGSYTTTAVLNATNDVDKSLYIPVIGPWMHIADRDSTDALDTVLIAGSGVLQGAGILLMTASMFIPERVPAATIQAGNVRLNVAPTAYGRGSAGIGAIGTF